MTPEIIPADYSRVTEILSIYQAYAYVPKEKLKKAQETGTLIHRAIEKHFAGEFFPLPSKFEGYFISFLNWNDTFIPSVEWQEKRLFDHDRKITGKPDMLAYVNGILTLIDFKTGSWAHPEIWNLQMHFYRQLMKKEDLLCIPDQFMIIQLHKEGKDANIFLSTHDVKVDHICNITLELFHYFPRKV